MFPIELPALRECTADLPALVQHLLTSSGRPAVDLPDDAMALLRYYPWPGNIRELKNALERAMLLAGASPLSVKHFAFLQAVGACAPRSSGLKPDDWDVQQLEMDHLRQALERFGGDMTKTAKALGMSRSTLYRKLKRQEEA